jgi:MoaA/NifB/PqqE/SkfB family radical SAM enzyme
MRTLSNRKEYFKKIVLRQVLKFIFARSKKSLIKIITFMGFVAPKKDKNFYKSVKNKLSEGNEGETGFKLYQFYRRILVESNSNFSDKFLTNLLVQGIFLNLKKKELAKKEGFHIPATVLISPTMRCNLSCIGCYAGNYTRSDDLGFEVIDRIIQEGKEAGISFFTILGGEPFIRDDMFRIYRKHSDVEFSVFTNGTLIDNKIAEKLVELGNIFPTLSIEGFEEETDQRRGKGIYKKVLTAMDILKKYNIPFGCSATVTRKNIKIASSDKFIDMIIEKGAEILWYFLYMPIGKNPDLSLMPTPDERLYLKERGGYIRENKPLFVIDFWNDAPYVGGCIAARDYIHINHKGDVEPCIFTHFAQVNIKNTSLKEAINCQFFKEIRKRQPFSDNLYVPCMLIDHPGVSRELYKNCDIYSTHDGAECLFSDISEELDEYSKGVNSIYADVWEKEKEFFCKKEALQKKVMDK